MNEIRIRATGALVSEQEFREMHDAVFPTSISAETLAEFGADPVLNSPTPETTPLQRAVRNGAVQDGLGNWMKSYEVVSLFEDQAAEDAYMASQLAVAKIAKNAEINNAREQANFTSFPYQGKNIASDNLSRSDIDVVASYISLFGTFPPSFPMGWKTIENTYVSLPNIDAFKDMYTAMAQQGTANFTHSQALKVLLQAATTVEAVNAISWDTPT